MLFLVFSLCIHRLYSIILYRDQYYLSPKCDINALRMNIQIYRTNRCKNYQQKRFFNRNKLGVLHLWYFSSSSISFPFRRFKTLTKNKKSCIPFDI